MQCLGLFLREHYPYLVTNRSQSVEEGRILSAVRNGDYIKADLDYTHDSFHHFIEEDGIRIARSEEIIAMKLETISRTGPKKDFCDLHAFLDKHCFQDMLRSHELRYPYSHEPDTIRKNIIDFTPQKTISTLFAFKGNSKN